MDFLKAEIDRKRKQAEAQIASSALSSGRKMKFIRHGDVVEESTIAEEPLADAVAVVAETIVDGSSTTSVVSSSSPITRSKSKSPERASSSSPTRNSSTASPTTTSATIANTAASTTTSPASAKNTTTTTTATTTATTPAKNKLSEDEYRKRFRQRAQPIRLFGETDSQRWERLKAVESKDLLDNEIQGQRNIYKDHADEVDNQLQLEALQGYSSAANASNSRGPNGSHHHNGDAPKDSKVDQLLNKFEPELHLISPDFLQVDSFKCYTLVYVFWKRLLRLWEGQLERRPDDEKRSYQGKKDTIMLKETSENMKPFFKMIKKREVEQNVMLRVADMCHWVHRREYVKANDSYLRLSIGNAPWPIGVTAVGIHERSARERIHADQVAHVLNDETQRKWVQGIKRLMTFAQKIFPADDFAKMVG